GHDFPIALDYDFSRNLNRRCSWINYCPVTVEGRIERAIRVMAHKCNAAILCLPRDDDATVGLHRHRVRKSALREGGNDHAAIPKRRVRRTVRGVADDCGRGTAVID